MMAVMFRHRLLTGLRALSPLSTTSSSSNVMEGQRLQLDRINKLQKNNWNLQQTHTIYSCPALFKKHNLKNVKEEQFELVNIFSPNETLLCEGTPLVFLDRICNSFTCFTYTEFNPKTPSMTHRNFKLAKKTDNDENVTEEKPLRKLKIVSNHELKSIEKLQTIVVEDGIAALMLKPRGEHSSSKKLSDLEQYVKGEMRHLCSFHFHGGNNQQQNYTLKRLDEGDNFYKRIFTLVYDREKEEVTMLMDYLKTVKSFS